MGLFGRVFVLRALESAAHSAFWTNSPCHVFLFWSLAPADGNHCQRNGESALERVHWKFGFHVDGEIEDAPHVNPIIADAINTVYSTVAQSDFAPKVCGLGFEPAGKVGRK